MILGTAITVASSPLAYSCATCFGDPDSDMVKGAQAGVLLLAVVTYAMLVSMGLAVAFILYKRNRPGAAEKRKPMLASHRLSEE